MDLINIINDGKSSSGRLTSTNQHQSQSVATNWQSKSQKLISNVTQSEVQFVISKCLISKNIGEEEMNASWRAQQCLTACN